MDAIIRLRGISRHYRCGENTVRALDGVDLGIGRGEYCSIIGRSGSGKSTLMNILGCLDAPSEGEYLLSGMPVSRMSERRLTDVRARTIGFVFQSFNLLAGLDAAHNVALPLMYRGIGRRERERAAAQALELVGLSDRARHKPGELSGGQQQRVAIARAIAGKPDILLADEPTGSLDSESGEQVISLLGRLAETGCTVIVITHDMKVAKAAGRIITISDGRVSG